jgi:hypothetical protein
LAGDVLHIAFDPYLFSFCFNHPFCFPISPTFLLLNIVSALFEIRARFHAFNVTMGRQVSGAADVAIKTIGGEKTVALLAEGKEMPIHPSLKSKLTLGKAKMEFKVKTLKSSHLYQLSLQFICFVS